VRELSNFVERLVVLSHGAVIAPEDINQWICEGMTSVADINDHLVGRKMDEIERAAIISTFKHFGGDRLRTAETLNISERTLRYKLKQFNIINSNERETEKEKTL
jgi:DNA-binding NtrC family response regulator